MKRTADGSERQTTMPNIKLSSDYVKQRKLQKQKKIKAIYTMEARKG